MKQALETLKVRKDYLAVRSGKKIHNKAFVLEIGTRTRESDLHARFGFTVTKRIGNAVVRNRIRRRLKEAVRACICQSISANRDYVLIGKKATLTVPFDCLVADLSSALCREGNKTRHSVVQMH